MLSFHETVQAGDPSSLSYSRSNARDVPLEFLQKRESAVENGSLTGPSQKIPMPFRAKVDAAGEQTIRSRKKLPRIAHDDNQMSAAALILLLACMPPGVAVIVAVWKLRSGVGTLPPTTTWIDEFSVERYRPMLRLLDNTEVQFLRSHSRVTPKLIAQLRRQRCRIFREYLGSLTTDFIRVSAALKLLMTQASTDRPDLASLLIRSQASFAVSMVLVRVQLVLYAFGIGTVEVGALLKLYEGNAA